MALQKNQTLKNGLMVNDAYIRIDTVSGYKDEITIGVNSYVSRQSFLDNDNYLEQKFYSFTPNTKLDAPEMWSQGYANLKTLPEYEGAVDVFENE